MENDGNWGLLGPPAVIEAYPRAGQSLIQSKSSLIVPQLYKVSLRRQLGLEYTKKHEEWDEHVCLEVIEERCIDSVIFAWRFRSVHISANVMMLTTRRNNERMNIIKRLQVLRQQETGMLITRVSSKRRLIYTGYHRGSEEQFA